jgi:uncharacterized protein YneF (UPF0154 family)
MVKLTVKGSDRCLTILILFESLLLLLFITLGRFTYLKQLARYFTNLAVLDNSGVREINYQCRDLSAAWAE